MKWSYILPLLIQPTPALARKWSRAAKLWSNIHQQIWLECHFRSLKTGSIVPVHNSFSQKMDKNNRNFVNTQSTLNLETEIWQETRRMISLRLIRVSYDKVAYCLKLRITLLQNSSSYKRFGCFNNSTGKLE